MSTKIDLGTQTQGILKPLHGGTGNTHGYSTEQIIMPFVNDSASTLALGTVVTRTAADPKLHAANSNGQQVLGVIVGRYSPTTGLFQSSAPDADETAAVCVLGRCVVRTASAADRGDYLRASTTAGEAGVSASILNGTFAYVLYQIDSDNAQALLWPGAGSGGSLTTDHGDLTGLTNRDHHQYVGSALSPNATITTTKSGANPTFNFDAIPESVLRVGDTYYCVYQSWAASPNAIRLASATDRDGTWTDVGAIYNLSDVTWFSAGAVPKIYAPDLVYDDGTFYLFYGVYDASDGSDGVIGVATASTITGSYTDHGSAILSRGAAHAWDSLRVGEPSVIHHDGLWYMAFMGEDEDLTFGTSEKIGIAYAASPTGTWTKVAGNPLLDWGAGGAWDDTLVADPYLFFDNGYYWMAYAGGGSTIGDGTRPWSTGLAYALDPTGTWTKYTGNPILSNGAGGTWEEKAAWRGSVFFEDGLYTGVYGGLDNALTAAKGGNYRMTVVAATGSVSYATPAIVLGTAAAAGAASTAIRSDSTIVAFDATTPAAVGTAATGSQAVAARRDHVHATGAGTPTTIAYSDAAATGTGPAAAMTDHRHGMAASPAITSTGELLIADTGTSSPLIFADILQNEAQTELLYADP